MITDQPPDASSTSVITDQPTNVLSTAVITEQFSGSPRPTPLIRISVFDFSPLPKARRGKEQGRKRKAQQAELLTGSPFKKILVAKRADANRKLIEKERREQNKLEKEKAKTGAWANLRKSSKGKSNV